MSILARTSTMMIPISRAAGDAYVELETADDLDGALRMHKRDMGNRWHPGMLPSP